VAWSEGAHAATLFGERSSHAILFGEPVMVQEIRERCFRLGLGGPGASLAVIGHESCFQLAAGVSILLFGIGRPLIFRAHPIRVLAIDLDDTRFAGFNVELEHAWL